MLGSTDIFPDPFSCNFLDPPRSMPGAALVPGLTLPKTQPKCNTVIRAGQGRARSGASILSSWNGREVKTPTLLKQSVGHPEKPKQSLSVEIHEWYHPTVNVRQQKKRERVCHPPANCF
jgi:hypothetical protein